MVWSTPYTATVGTVLTAATWNTYVRDDLAYLKGLLDGTGSDTVTVPSIFAINNDANFNFSYVAAVAPRWTADSGGDFLQYQRSLNQWEWQIASQAVLTLDANGKLTGKGFYSSGEVSLTSGNSANFAHGLGARPRAVWGFSSTSTGTEDSKTTPVSVGAGGSIVWAQLVDTTNLNVANNSGVTRYIHMYAMR